MGGQSDRKLGHRFENELRRRCPEWRGGCWTGGGFQGGQCERLTAMPLGKPPGQRHVLGGDAGVVGAAARLRVRAECAHHRVYAGAWHRASGQYESFDR